MVKKENQESKLLSDNTHSIVDNTVCHKPLKNNLTSAEAQRKSDKLTFLLTVMTMASYIYVMGRFPDYFFYFYSIAITTIVLAYRLYDYKVKRWHYFTRDFCYFGNYGVYIFVLFFPNSKFTYIGIFSYGLGVIASGVLLTGNSLVLHDKDYMASGVLHMNPMMIAYNLHWVSQHNKERGWELYDSSKDYLSFSFVAYFFLASTSLYLVWAVLYYINIFVVNAKSIEERKEITLFSYCCERMPNAKRRWYKFGAAYAPLLYMLTHFLQYFAATAAALIGFFSIHASLFVIWFIFGVGVWNAAGFYMEYFPKKYEANLAKIDETYKANIGK